MKKRALILISLFLIVSCNRNDGILDDNELYKTQIKVVEAGEKKAYTKLFIYYDEKKANSSLMPYALLMAHQYNDKDAYYDVYEIMIRLFNKNKFEHNLIQNLDTETRKFALNHLIKSSNLGNSYADEILNEYYLESNYIEKDPKKGYFLTEESEHGNGSD